MNVPAPASLTINFDSNIISITGPSNMSGTITTSGESLGGSAADGMGYKFTVALQDGYIIDSISTELNEYCGYLDRFGADYFWIVAESGGINGTITITSKLAVSRKSVDLTTLPGWSSLSSGSHSITIVAKAEGYRDSEPSAAVTVEKAPEPVEDPFITFTGETSDFTLTATNKEWDGIVEYSTDKTTWTTWDGSEISSSGQKLYLRGSGNTTFYTRNGAQFVLSERAGCSGNLNTLLEYSNPPTTLSANDCYDNMFWDCTSLITAPELPATTLADNCYYGMFWGCTSLTTAPELPATTLAYGCYSSMFGSCDSLTSAPELPATTLADFCYHGMFNSCKSLTTAPELPATTLADACYNTMFQGCINLTTAPELPATTLADSCYHSMFNSCKSLTTAPALPATTLARSCYYNMFYGCTNLTTAPALPATMLANSCYEKMFQRCTIFKVSSTRTGTYQYAWRIPTSGTISSTATDWNTSMLANTGGTFTSNPSINTTYYVENEPV